MHECALQGRCKTIVDPCAAAARPRQCEIFLGCDEVRLPSGKLGNKACDGWAGCDRRLWRAGASEHRRAREVLWGGRQALQVPARGLLGGVR